MAKRLGRQGKSWIIIFLALIILTGLFFYTQLFTFNLGNLRQGGVTPDGGEVYAISQSFRTDGPRFKEVDINPRKVSLGDKQLLIVKMDDPRKVASVKAVTELDSSAKEIRLEKGAGEEWKAEWMVEDTSTKTYRTTFTAVDKNGKENQFTLAWSDPCGGVPLGGDGILSANCTISGVDGVDNGNLNLNGRTLTIPSGATFVWNPGKVITTNGTIALSGELKKTYLWIKDGDNDSYAPNSTDQRGQDTQPSGYYRRYTRSGTNDCYDLNANAKPGQTGTFSSNRGDGSFDYDCDGGITASPYGIGTGLNFGGGQCCYSAWVYTTDGYLGANHCGQTVYVCPPYYPPGGNCGGCGYYYCQAWQGGNNPINPTGISCR